MEIPLSWLGTALALFMSMLAIFLYNEKKNRDYCKSHGVQYGGNMLVFLLRGMFFGGNFFNEMKLGVHAMKLSNIKYSVSSNFGKYSVIITDPEILRKVLVKDFDHFVNSQSFEVADKTICSKMLSLTKDEKWRTLRSKLSPTFTTGRIKRVFSIFNSSGDKLVKYVEKMLDGNSEIDVATACSKYTMDIVATAACAIDSKAFDQIQPSMFERYAKKLMPNFNFTGFLKIMLLNMPSVVSNALNVTIFDLEAVEFFSRAVKESLRIRREKGIRHDDFIQLMMEASENKLQVDEAELDTFEKDAQVKTTGNFTAADLLDDDGIAANASIFMFAGFDPTYSTLSFALYELALHQEIQSRLRNEINSVLNDNDGKLRYEELSKMTYLDMVLNETMRKYPPVINLQRTCNARYTLPDSTFVLNPGDVVMAMTLGMHWDPEYFPSPQNFDPERFSPENKSKINPYVFMPFGQGPRSCIGRRFALQEVRVALIKLVKNFVIEPSSNTVIPVEFDQSMILKPKGKLLLSLRKISE